MADILGKGNVTLQGVSTGTDSTLDLVRVLVVDSVGEEAVAPSTSQPSTSQPCVTIPVVDAGTTDSLHPPLFVLETPGEDWDMPPPLKRQRVGACMQQAEKEEEDEAALQRKKLKLEIEVLELKKTAALAETEQMLKDEY